MPLSRDDYMYMTDYIKRQYGYSAGWCKKVDNMPDNQIRAIFHEFIERNNRIRQRKRSKKNTKPIISQGTQLCWDFKKGEIVG